LVFTATRVAHIITNITTGVFNTLQKCGGAHFSLGIPAKVGTKGPMRNAIILFWEGVISAYTRSIWKGPKGAKLTVAAIGVRGAGSLTDGDRILVLVVGAPDANQIPSALSYFCWADPA